MPLFLLHNYVIDSIISLYFIRTMPNPNLTNTGISIGHDVVDIHRIKAIIDKYQNAFLQKIYTTAEIQYCLSKKDPYQSFAARFAAKEAIAKAFHSGIGQSFGWKTASINNNLKGLPEVALDDQGKKLLQSFGGKNIIISLSHTRFIASAVALIF